MGLCRSRVNEQSFQNQEHLWLINHYLLLFILLLSKKKKCVPNIICTLLTITTTTFERLIKMFLLVEIEHKDKRTQKLWRKKFVTQKRRVRVSHQYTHNLVCWFHPWLNLQLPAEAQMQITIRTLTAKYNNGFHLISHY